MPRAVGLLSGGLDSATALAIALHEGFELTAVSFDYGQRHRCELDAAAAVAAALGIADHRVLRLDPAGFRGSALTDRAIAVPPSGARDPHEIPVTYVPARNTIFLSYALGIAETLGAHDVFLGVNAVDYSGYPDCRPEFLRAFEALARLATRAGVEGHPTRFHAPLIHWSKDEIIRRGTELEVPYELTVSCYDPTADGAACGRCESCALRRAGFAKAGRPDPTRYARST